jgi:hypothetical protein
VGEGFRSARYKWIGTSAVWQMKAGSDDARAFEALAGSQEGRQKELCLKRANVAAVRPFRFVPRVVFNARNKSMSGCWDWADANRQFRIQETLASGFQDLPEHRARSERL